MWHLFLQYWHKTLSSLHQNIPFRKRVNLPFIHLTSPELFQIHLHYVCNLYCAHYVHNIKILSILSSWLWRIKTRLHLYHLVAAGLLAFLMLGSVAEGVTTSCWAETQVQFTLLCTWFLWKENLEHSNTSPSWIYKVRTQSMTQPFLNTVKCTLPQSQST